MLQRMFPKVSRWTLLVALLTTTGWQIAQTTPEAHPGATPAEQSRQQLEAWRKSMTPQWMNDFADLGRYRDANAELAVPGPDERRVVFMGDSITDAWRLDDYFPGKPYINRGISGQTTPQMLIRFRPDVIDLKPKVVVILAGTNDIAGNTGPMQMGDIENNYASMAELARANGIGIVFSSVLPVNNYTPRAELLFVQRPPEKILELNRWMKNYCAKNGFVYLDYLRAMVDEKGLLKRDLAEDGLHPNPAGYKIMAPLAEAAIEKALSQK
jgi:lysophospholipase L1-like esterase